MERERNQEAEPDYPNACWFLKNMEPLMSHHYKPLLLSEKDQPNQKTEVS